MPNTREKLRVTMKNIFLVLTAVNLGCMILSLAMDRGQWLIALFGAVVSFVVALWEG